MAHFATTVIATILVITALFAVIINAASDEVYDYGIMIDAGSSGTRTFLYKWVHREASASMGPFSQPITQEGWSKKVKIPISDYATTPENVHILLNQTVEFAKQQLTAIKVPAKNFAKIPIFLGATAGVRMMPHQQRVTLFDKIRKFYANCGFKFESHHAKVLSGEEEGFFGWLAVNYLSKSILPQNNETNPNPPAVYGALDMGGASTQITCMFTLFVFIYCKYCSSSVSSHHVMELPSFPPPPHLYSLLLSTHLFIFILVDTLGQDILEGYFEYSPPTETRHQLYTHSFLQYGANQWWTRLNNEISKAAADGEEVQNRCLASGFTFEWKNSNGKTVSMVGTDLTQHEDCYALNKKQLYLDTPCLTDTCSINGVYQAPINKDVVFYAFSGFVSTLKTYGTQTDDHKYSLDEILALAAEVCPLSKEKLIEKYPKADPAFLPRGCASLLYFHTLLKDAYGIQTAQQSIFAKGDINGTEVSWALGRIVYEVNLSHYELLVPGSFVYLCAIGILSLAVLVCLILLFRTWSTMTKQQIAHDHAVNDELLFT
jgi:hypothetical protein